MILFNIKMKSKLIFLLLITGFFMMGCRSISIKSVYESSRADWIFDGDYGAVYPTSDEFEFEGKIKGYKRYGVEVSSNLGGKVNVYGRLGMADINKIEVEDLEIDGVDSNPSAITADGSKTLAEPEGVFICFGARAAAPEDGGVRLDWGAQFGVHAIVDEFDTSAVENKYTFVGSEFEGNFGALYAFKLNDRLLLSPRGGAKFKVLGGSMTWEQENTPGIDYSHDATYWMFTVGPYVGVDLKLFKKPGLDFSLDFFIGSSHARTFQASLGIMF